MPIIQIRTIWVPRLSHVEGAGKNASRHELPVVAEDTAFASIDGVPKSGASALSLGINSVTLGDDSIFEPGLARRDAACLQCGVEEWPHEVVRDLAQRIRLQGRQGVNFDLFMSHRRKPFGAALFGQLDRVVRSSNCCTWSRACRRRARS